MFSGVWNKTLDLSTKNCDNQIMFKKIAEAEAVCGGLSKPSKMPCYGYSIPARHCAIGAKLRKVLGSVCAKCYALKGRYVFQSVVEAMERRFKTLSHPQWHQAIAFLINRRKQEFFRWHDSGDIQSIAHLRRICDVCELTPNCKHWLPTREYGIVREYLAKYKSFPNNLTVRLSAYMVNDAASEKSVARVAEQLGLSYSTVETSQTANCPSWKNSGKCGDCRKCWNPNIKKISYKTH